MKKNYRYNQFTSIFIFALVLLAACEGPAGPQGPQGERGPQGEEGNANIMYSDWMDIEWSEESSDSQKEMSIRESRITVDFLNDGGFVLMFMKAESNGIVQSYTIPLGSGNFHFGFRIFALEGDDGGITFFLRSLDGTAIPDSLWEDFQIRYVLIPGSVNLAAAGLNVNDYEQVVQYFGIPD